MFDTGLIDSLKIRVKLDKVQILDKRLVTDFIAYYPSLAQLDGEDLSTQELLGDNYRKAEPYTKIINGITYRFYIKAFIDKNKIAQEYVVFQISAKMLKKQYFEGITFKNIDLIINDINDFGVLKISKKEFLDGLVSDIDICINQLIDQKSLKTAFSLMLQFPNKGKLPLIHPFKSNNNQVMNLGMDFNKREKASNTSPYCKIYHKGFELLSKSIIFYKAYLEPMKTSIIDNLVRYEFTIKAHKHKEYLISKGFNANFKTLNELLKVKPADLKKIAQTGLKHYIDTFTHSKANHLLSPTDLMLQYFVEQLIQMGADNDKIMGFAYKMECPVTRSRSKTKVKKLIDDLTRRDINLMDKLKHNNDAYNFLSKLGL